MRNALIVLACVLGCAVPVRAQPRAAADPVDAVVRHLERVLTAGDRAAFPALFDAWVAKALAPDRTQRIQSAPELTGALAVL